jgi:magnesium transporter
MSEWSMMTGPENWRIAYPAFLVAMLVIGIVNYYGLRRLESTRTDLERRPARARRRRPAAAPGDNAAVAARRRSSG